MLKLTPTLTILCALLLLAPLARAEDDDGVTVLTTKVRSRRFQSQAGRAGGHVCSEQLGGRLRNAKRVRPAALSVARCRQWAGLGGRAWLAMMPYPPSAPHTNAPSTSGLIGPINGRFSCVLV